MGGGGGEQQQEQQQWQVQGGLQSDIELWRMQGSGVHLLAQHKGRERLAAAGTSATTAAASNLDGLCR
jgi:hypothetical protein